MVKSGFNVAEDLVQKLQQTADKLIFVPVLLEVGQAAAAAAAASSHPLLHVLTELADREQPRLKFLGDVGHLPHVAAEQGEDSAAGRLLFSSNQPRPVQRGAGGSGEQSISRLQDSKARMALSRQNEVRALYVSLFCVFKWVKRMQNLKCEVSQRSLKTTHEFIQGSPVTSVSLLASDGWLCLSLCLEFCTFLVM